MIKEFQGLYRPLSNFWSIQIEYEGGIYPSVENAYQAAKCLRFSDRIKFENLTAPEAKALGKVIDKRPDWHQVNLQIMYELNKQKFSSGYLRDFLLNTLDRELQEGNTWGDTFWGVNLYTGIGENHLGKILMQVRKELRLASHTQELA